MKTSLILLTAGLSESDADLLQDLKSSMEHLRVMSFEKMEDLSKLTADELDNYEAEILSILLIARAITPADIQDKGNPIYRMLSHLLENYIQDIVTNAVRLIKTILKALPIAAYKAMKQSVEVLWSA